MAKLVKSIVIQAPAEKIFAYVNDPYNLPEFWPSMLEVKDVKRLPNGGTSCKFAYKMAGIRLEAFMEDTECVLNQRTVSKVSGGIEAWTTFTYEPVGQGTKVTLEDEYKVPVPVIGKLAEAVILKINEQEGLTVLANLKARMEG
jgi:uncharacterized protein YndB with AHSA1/START domain